MIENINRNNIEQENDEDKSIKLNRLLSCNRNNENIINNNHSVQISQEEQKLKEKPNIMKSKTMTSKRYDRFGNPIGNFGENKGQYHVSFLDDVTNNKNMIVEEIKVENFKEFNKIEEPSSTGGGKVGCCLIV